MRKSINKKVLIVDDYDLTCSMASMYFAEFGYIAHAASTAKQGLELALTNDYEVILVDLCLPDHSGLNLITELRSYESLEKSKIIVFTGTDHEIVNYYHQYGVDGILLKPCTLSKVRQVINSCLLTSRTIKATSQLTTFPLSSSHTCT